MEMIRCVELVAWGSDDGVGSKYGQWCGVEMVG